MEVIRIFRWNNERNKPEIKGNKKEDEKFYREKESEHADSGNKERYFLQGKEEDCEIFGVAFANDEYKEDIFRSMLCTTLNYCKRNGTKYMTFFCEEYMQKVVMELGFHYVGKYVLYVKTIE